MPVNYGGAYVELLPKVGRDFESQAASQLEGPLRGATGRLGGALKGVLGGVLGVAGGLVAGVGIERFIQSSVAEARESNKVLAQTDAVIKSTAGAAGVSADHVDKLATKLSGLTGIDDEVVASTENLLLTFTNIGAKSGIFDETTAAVLDMSAALGQDTKSSAIQLGKALNDPIKGITALQRVGVSFTADQKKQIAALVASGKTMEAQKLILAEIKKEFGGSAAAIATPAQKMSVAWGNFKETLGKAVIPVLDRVETFLADKLPGAADVVARVLPRVTDVIFRGVERLGEIFTDVGVVVRDFWETFQDPGITSSGGFALVEQFASSVRRVFDGLKALVSGDSQGFAELIDNAFGNTGRFVGPLRDLGNAVIGFVGFLADHPDLVKDFAIGIAGLVVAEKAATGINSIGRFAGELPSKLNPANTELGKLVTNLGKVVSKTASVTVQGAQDAAGAVQKVIDGLANVKDRTVKITASVTEDVKNKGQGLLDQIVNFLKTSAGPAIGAALGAAFASVDVGALAASVGTAIAGALAAVAASPVLIAAAIVVAIAAVGAIVYAFRDQLATFFTDTLPSFLGTALGVLAAALVTLLIVVPVTIIETLVEWVPKIVEAFIAWIPGAAAAIGGFFASLPGIIVGFFVSLPGFIAGAAAALPGLIVGFFANLPELLLSILQRIPGYFAFVFTEVLPRIVITALTGIPGLVLSFFTSLPELMGGILGRVADAFGHGWDLVNRLTGGKLGEVTRTIGGAVNEIVGFFSGLPGRIGGFLTNVFSPLWEGFRRFVNLIIRGWNSLHFGIPELDTHIPGVGKIGGGSVGVPQIPYLAKGADVLESGLAFIADRGPELVNLPAGAKVTPLNRAAGGFGDRDLVIYQTIELDGRELQTRTVRYTAEALREHQRAGATV